MQIKVPSASGRLCDKENLLQPVRNTIQIWIVTGQPCKISALVPQTTERSLSVCVAVVVYLLTLTSNVFGRHRTSSGIFGNDRVVFKNSSTPRIKISRLYLRKSWQVYTCNKMLGKTAVTKMTIIFLKIWFHHF